MKLLIVKLEEFLAIEEDLNEKLIAQEGINSRMKNKESL